ncbi:MAG: thioredoxin family protein [Bacteroidetes bacterium]|nr:thioredoxin family protein [Bacteroidota bacterium]
MKVCLYALIALLILSLTPGSYARAQQKDTDTISSAGVQFSSAPTDSQSAKPKADTQAEKTDSKAATTQITAPAQPTSLWGTFIVGLIAGFLAFLMPCIYPLLPLTVSFFTKLGGTRSKATGLAIFYMVSIVVIYVGLAMILTLAFGPGVLNDIATNGVFNIVIFILLVMFGISFLGAFEITLPSSMVNKVDALSDRGGIIGIFFMALTLVLVSFSCTAGVVATALGDAFTKGDRLAPMVSMLGFSTALGLPFAIAALFPSVIQSLPKSGGWLNSVKVVLGLIEIAFAMKFLSNVDLAYHWNWFDREVYLSLWIAIGIVLGLYLIGKIKFSHDSDLKYLSVPRLFLSIAVFAFVIYMIPGLWGAPLKVISGFLPPPATQDFDLTRIAENVPASSGSAQQVSIKDKKYADRYTRIKVNGLDSWYDYDQALQVSKELHKPILIDFTGFACVNCRQMENKVWVDKTVFKHLRDDFVLLQLVVDDRSELDPAEQYISKFSGKKIKTLGGKWADFEESRFNANAQPFYVMLDSNGNLLKDKDGKEIQPSPADFNIASYTNFLESGIQAYQNAH